MPRNSRINERNQKIKQRFAQIKAKNPQWRIDALVKVVADEFFLSEVYIFKIIKRAA